jgi:hypothetical protein
MGNSNSTRIQRRVRILVILIAVLATFHIVLILVQSARPDYYYEYTGVRALVHELAYPYFEVTVSIGILLWEAMFLTFVLTRHFGRLWLRGIFCLAVLMPLTFFGILGAMHSPPYYLAHVRWLFSVTLLLLLAVFASACANFYHRFRGKIIHA